MSDFRDAIAVALSDYFNAHRGPWPITATPEHQRGYADAVLAMPEMQAIRLQLLSMANDLLGGCNDDVNHGQQHRGGVRWWLLPLPDSLIDWVLGGAT